METKANHLLVGIVSIFLLISLAFGVVWLARLSDGVQKEYDILFQQSVSGLSKGSEVTFAGVPVGQVREIQLYEKDPDFVRVRIGVRDDVPILVGTAATIQGSFTGISSILLDGARNGAPPVTCASTACPEGVPVIPPKNGGLSALLADAPMLLERASTLLERMTELLSDKNQREFAGILANTNKITSDVAIATPQLQTTISNLNAVLADASRALASFEKTAQSADSFLANDGTQLAGEMRKTLKTANSAAESLATLLDQTTPLAKNLGDSTLPEAEGTMAELRATSKALRDVTETLKNQGAAALIGGPALPEYKPGSRK